MKHIAAGCCPRQAQAEVLLGRSGLKRRETWLIFFKNIFHCLLWAKWRSLTDSNVLDNSAWTEGSSPWSTKTNHLSESLKLFMWTYFLGFLIPDERQLNSTHNLLIWSSQIINFLLLKTNEEKFSSRISPFWPTVLLRFCALATHCACARPGIIGHLSYETRAIWRRVKDQLTFMSRTAGYFFLEVEIRFRFRCFWSRFLFPNIYI